MSLSWIVKGDKTSHGGTVIEGDPTFDTHGKPVALVGHKVTCPKCKGGPFPIVTGAPDFVCNGRPVARHGDKTACGATLISGQAVSRWSAERSPATVLHSSRFGNESSAEAQCEQYGRRFLITDSETGKPLANRKFVAMVCNTTRVGTTDNDGYAHVEANAGESIQLHLVFEAPTGALVHEGI